MAKPEKTFFTMDDFVFKGKTVLVRVDINTPLDPKKGLQDSPRIAEHAATLKALSEKGAKVVALAHQGRPYSDDFVSLKGHAALLSKHAGLPVGFIDGLFSDAVLARVAKLKLGEILLLENTRFYAEETEEVKDGQAFLKSRFLQRLSPAADFFVNDAFSVSHRLQASVVGPSLFLPSCAGLVMERELNGLQRALEHAEHPNVYVLGGAKPDDVFELLKYACETPAVDKVLTSGILGELCILAGGFSVGPAKMKLLKENGFDALVPGLKALLARYSLKIEFPQDVAVLEGGKRKEYSVKSLSSAKGPSFDLGAKTISRYAQILSTAKTIYFKGPVGKYEDPLFAQGTREILRAIAGGKAFSLMGGGHSLNALEKFGIPQGKISHVSLAGGAVVAYLQGKPLPGVEALRQAYARGKKRPSVP